MPGPDANGRMRPAIRAARLIRASSAGVSGGGGRSAACAQAAIVSRGGAGTSSPEVFALI